MVTPGKLWNGSIARSSKFILPDIFLLISDWTEAIIFSLLIFTYMRAAINSAAQKRIQVITPVRIYFIHFLFIWQKRMRKMTNGVVQIECRRFKPAMGLKFNPLLINRFVHSGTAFAIRESEIQALLSLCGIINLNLCHFKTIRLLSSAPATT